MTGWFRGSTRTWFACRCGQDMLRACACLRRWAFAGFLTYQTGGALRKARVEVGRGCTLWSGSSGRREYRTDDLRCGLQHRRCCAEQQFVLMMRSCNSTTFDTYSNGTAGILSCCQQMTTLPYCKPRTTRRPEPTKQIKLGMLIYHFHALIATLQIVRPSASMPGPAGTGSPSPRARSTMTCPTRSTEQKAEGITSLNSGARTCPETLLKRPRRSHSGGSTTPGRTLKTRSLVRSSCCASWRSSRSVLPLTFPK